MSKYSGQAVTIPMPINHLYDKVTDVDGYEQMLLSVPDSLKSQLSGLSIKDGKIIIDAPGVGRVELVKEQEEPPTHVAFRALNAPVPILLTLTLEEVDPETTRLEPAIEAELPAMLKPFLNTRLQDGATMLGKAFAKMFGGW